MKWKWLFLIGLILLVALLTFGIRRQLPKTVLVLDKEDRAGLPGNFRMTRGELPFRAGNAPNLWGLAALNASGSSQFTEGELHAIRAKIGAGYAATVVDVRQESHGFVNSMAVSWYGKGNQANIGLTKAEVLADEARKLNDLARAKTITIHRGRPGKDADQGKPLRVTAPFTVRNEKRLAQELGMGYYRVPVTDHHRPTDAAVDDFIQFAKTLPNNAWLHFHCRAGVGRTTTFLIMYDMMRNAKQVDFRDIIDRQMLLGGSDIIRHYDRKNSRNPNTRAIHQFLQQFYCYCQGNPDNYATSWREWLQGGSGFKDWIL